MNDAGKMLMPAGLGRGWCRRLSGDIHYQKGNFNFYFPFVTRIVVSIVLSLIFRLFRK